MATSPCQVDIILDNIFQYLNGRELIRIRGVCRRWWDVSRRFLQKNIDQVPVHFGGGDISFSQDEDDDDNDDRVCPSQQVVNFNCYGYSDPDPSVLTFTNFWFTNISLGHFYVQDFFNKYGRIIKVLKIEFIPGMGGDINILDTDILRTLVLDQCPNLVELGLISIPKGWETSNTLLAPEEINSPSCSCKIEKLTISHTPGNLGRGGSLTYTHFVWGMAQICPKLKDLVILINDEGQSQFSAYAKVFFTYLLEEPKMDNFKIKLVNLKLSHLASETLNLLPNSLNLKRFEVSSIRLDQNTVVNKFVPFLDAQSSSLLTLSIENILVMTKESTLSPPIFPNCMDKLTFLKLGLGNEMFAPIDFATQFPSLRTLILFDSGEVVHPSSSMDSFTSSRSLPSLTTLELPPYLTPKHFQNFGTLLQHVRHLCLGYQSSFWLDKVGENCRDLGSLYICGYPGPHLKSSTGLTLEEIQEGFDSSQITSSPEHEELNPTFHYLLNFTKIRELTIHGGATKEDLIPSSGNVGIINDDTFREIVSRMANLQYLHITMENSVTDLDFLKGTCPHLDVDGRHLHENLIHLESQSFYGNPHAAFLLHN